MFLKTIKTTLIFATFLLFTNCSEYQKLLNNIDPNVKYKAAEKYYKAGEYRKANRLFEQITPTFRGKPQAQRVVFFYANTYFQLKDYNLAAYQFESFVKSYPKSDRIQEATYLAAKSYYMLSPKYSLDQQDTNKAIDKLQIFLDNYPNSEFSEEANILIAELQVKIEKKFFEIAKQYYTIRDYKAAMNSFDNFLNDYPGTQFKEDALFHKFLSNYELALNSIFTKKEERLKSAQEIANTLLRYFPETLYMEDLDMKSEKIEKELNQFDQLTTTTK